MSCQLTVPMRGTHIMSFIGRHIHKGSEFQSGTVCSAVEVSCTSNLAEDDGRYLAVLHEGARAAFGTNWHSNNILLERTGSICTDQSAGSAIG
jgi:hypothetical protein